MIEDFVQAASTFQRPHELGALLERHRREWSRDALFNNPRLKPFKEAWQATMFGLGYERLAEVEGEVRICEPAQFPDFQLKVTGHTHDFESRLVTLKRLGSAYRGDSSAGPPVPMKPETLPPFDPELIRKAVQDKASMNYAGTVHLLLYLSLPARDIQFPEVPHAVLAGGGAKFESVWIVTYDAICCPHPSPRLNSCDGWLRMSVQIAP